MKCMKEGNEESRGQNGEQEILTLINIGANGFDSFGCSTGIGG